MSTPPPSGDDAKRKPEPIFSWPPTPRQILMLAAAAIGVYLLGSGVIGLLTQGG